MMSLLRARSAAVPWLIAALLATAAAAACSKRGGTDAKASPKPPCIGCSVDGKTTPRTADGHPDLSGYWSGFAPAPTAGGPARGGGGRGQVMHRYADGSVVFDFSTEYNAENGVGRICQDESCQAPNQPPYNDKWMPRVKQIAATEFGGTTVLDPIQQCRPLGVPRAGIDGVQIVQTPQLVAVLYEAAPYSTFRLIYTDGRPHPNDLDPTFFGHSVGHWEGDTLAVDVVGLTDESWLGGGGATGRTMFTSVHSDKLHVVERWTRSADVLTYEATVEDPVAFTKPWVIGPRRVKHAGAGEEMVENICSSDDTQHFVAPNPNDNDIKTRCGYRCQGDAPEVASAEKPVDIAGTWEVTSRLPDRTATEKWSIQQKGHIVTATAAADDGAAAVSGSVDGAFLRVSEKHNGKEYKVRATVDGNQMDGSIALGAGQEYLWQAKRVR